MRGGSLLAIDSRFGLAETYETRRTRQSEKRTNKARQRLARETGISGGVPVSISDAHRAEMRPC
jgi:hypothetical protein